MATRKRKASEENPKKTNTEFFWTYDEIQHLLQTSFNFKSKCEFEGLSWESKRSKYKQMFQNVSTEYSEDPEKFPNKRTITKERITAKLKSIRTGFRKAVDAGQKSGSGKVFFIFYDLYETYGEALQPLQA